MAIDLVDVAAGTGGFVIYGQDADDLSGFSVASAGDINGDGFDDLIVGAINADGPGNTRNSAGDSYVVFGKASGFAAAIDLATIAAGTGGFVIYGQDAGVYVGDRAGQSVSSAGDINGDGFDDLIVGAPYGDGPGNTRNDAGESYVVFGHTGAFAASIELATIAAGTGGFVIYGQDGGTFGDNSGFSVSSAGDINGDGFADLIIGAFRGDGPGNARYSAGDSYVVFGKASGFAAAIDLANVAAGTGGFVIHGQDANDQASAVSSAGDINGDGFDDLIIGARFGDGPGNARNAGGDSYVVFGKASGFAAAIDLTTIAAGTGGFVIYGQDAADQAGTVSSAGDINGDGFDDLIVGAFRGDGPGNARNNAGDSYVVFGKASGFAAAIDLATIAAGTGGFVIHGQDAVDYSGIEVASAGDLNGDGFDDLIVGATNADGPGNTRDLAGDSYVVFGKAAGFGATIDLADVAAGTGGFVIHGQDSTDQSGASISSAGDIDGDGFDDLIIGARIADGPGNARSAAGDTYVLFGSATIGGSANAVTHLGTAAGETLAGTAGADDMVGGRGNDVLLGGGGGADVLRGGEGNDTLTVADANFARVVGGTGSDILAFSGAITLVDTDFRRIEGIESLKLGNGATSLTLGLSAAHAITALTSNQLHIEIDASLVTAAAVTIDGSGLGRGLTISTANNATAVTLTGGAGNDLFTGGGGNDTFDGGGGIDTLIGGPGDDSYIVDTLTDTITEASGAGTDTIRTALASYTLATANVENLTGTAGTGQTLTGDGNANVVTAGSGNDTLDGSGGVDTMIGGAGNDIYFADSASDTVTEALNEGSDEVRASAAAYALAANIENLIGTVNTGQTLTGNGLANIIMAGSGNDTIDGGGDVDSMTGGAGNDIYFADSASDTVTEALNEGSDEVRASAVTYALAANIENLIGTVNTGQTLTGNGLVNIITAGAGNDTLDGGAGIDAMIGGAGNDIYFVDNQSETITEAAGAGTGTDEIRTALASYSMAAVANVENLTGTVNTGQTLTGNALANIITGGAGADAMTGGAGNDIYFVDNAGDTVTEDTNEGTDEIRTSLASYTLGANVENLAGTVNTGQTLTGNTLANTITGGSGADTLDGGTNADTMAGGAGNDIYFADSASDAVTENLGEGTDEVRASSATYALSANVENLVGTVNTGQALTGNGLANTITAGSGNDTLDGGAGNDAMAGGAGNDLYVIDSHFDTVTEAASADIDEVRTALASYSLSEIANVENLTGTVGTGQSLIGNDVDNVITGAAGNDLLGGGGGNDTLNGGGGNNILGGGDGNDVYFVSSGSDQVVEFSGQGTDTVNASVTYMLTANVENLTLTGAAYIGGYGNALANSILGRSVADVLDGQGGADTMTGGDGSDAYFVDNAGDQVIENVGEGFDAVYASVSATLGANVEILYLQGAGSIDGTGNGLVNYLAGNAGNNTLDGMGGVDMMVGGTGNDTYGVDTNFEIIVENVGEGTDTVNASASYVLTANIENLALQGSANINGYGNALVNSIVGNTGNNALDGGAGADTMAGGAGSDAYFVDNAGDVVTENAGEGTDAVYASLGYTLGANLEHLYLQGAGNLSGTGNATANYIQGNAGDNAINGMGGGDVLIGNAGNDTFVFNAGQAQGDTIIDFDGQGAALGDALQFAGFGTVGATFTNVGGNQWQIHSGLDAHNEVITLSNGASVHATDFLFI